MTLPLSQPVDVRAIPAMVRHATIFGLLEHLDLGEALNIVNDHDPAPLRRQIEGRYGDAYSWTYVLSGPALWQVEIGRAKAEGGAYCGGEDDACTCGY